LPLKDPEPGLRLFTEQADMLYAIFAVSLISNLRRPWFQPATW
jgi:hypothetical protein